MGTISSYLCIITILIVVCLACHSGNLEGFTTQYNACFKSVWSPTEKKEALELLSFFDNFSKKHKITYFMMYGTLIGQKRHSGLIPWDDDIDVGMLERDCKKLESNFQSKIFTLYKVREGFYKIFYTKKPKISVYKWSWPFLDIFVFKQIHKVSNTGEETFGEEEEETGWDDLIAEEEEETGWNDLITEEEEYIKTGCNIRHKNTELYSSYDPDNYYRFNDVFPLHTVKFENLKLPCPHNPTRILNKYYGSDWKDICDSGHYNHKKERPRKYQARIKCREALKFV